MAKNYKISVDEIDRYIKYIKKYKVDSRDNKRRMDAKMTKAHALWEDVNYERAQTALDEVGRELEALFAALDDTAKSLNKMNDAYKNYLRRGK